jgi:hypothetical protein
MPYTLSDDELHTLVCFLKYRQVEPSLFRLSRKLEVHCPGFDGQDEPISEGIPDGASLFDDWSESDFNNPGEYLKFFVS